MRTARPALALIAAAALAGCGDVPSTSTTTSAHPPPAPSPAVPNGTVVRIHDGAFFPPRVIVIVGHPIQWENFDSVGRAVQATRGARFRSGVLKMGQLFSWTPHHLGKVRYRDPARPGFVGTIVVVD